jgi:protein-tyrosine phosphatase
MTAPLALVVLCTGNICRSPLTEVLLRDRLADLPVVVTSAGTRAVVGAPMAPLAAPRVLARGLDPAHAAAQLTVQHLTGADLVLGLAREHRRAAIELHPRVVRRAMTLPPTTPDLDDVPDPWGRDDQAYAAADLQISDAVDSVSRWLHRAAGRS